MNKNKIMETTLTQYTVQEVCDGFVYISPGRFRFCN